jgi:hypothetical protein
MDEIRPILLIAALSNAVKHKSVPAGGAGDGAVLGSSIQELRSRVANIKGILGSILEEVSLSRTKNVKNASNPSIRSSMLHSLRRRRRKNRSS